jgi:hypothetical protein
MAVGFAERPPERPPLEAVLWRVRKDERIAEAIVRDVPSYGFELRFLVRGALVYSRMFRKRHSLEQLATEKRRAFEALGWTVVLPAFCD